MPRWSRAPRILFSPTVRRYGSTSLMTQSTCTGPCDAGYNGEVPATFAWHERRVSLHNMSPGSGVSLGRCVRRRQHRGDDATVQRAVPQWLRIECWRYGVHHLPCGVLQYSSIAGSTSCTLWCVIVSSLWTYRFQSLPTMLSPHWQCASRR
jgi:hypothetical protein